MKSNEKVLEVHCSLQRALLGAVTPNLRAVTVSVNEDEYHVHVYYQEELSEVENELISLAHTYFAADFPPPEFTTLITIEVIPAPQKIPDEGRLVYERYEGSLS